MAMYASQEKFEAALEAIVDKVVTQRLHNVLKSDDDGKVHGVDVLMEQDLKPVLARLEAIAKKIGA